MPLSFSLRSSLQRVEEYQQAFVSKQTPLAQHDEAHYLIYNQRKPKLTYGDSVELSLLTEQ